MAQAVLQAAEQSVQISDPPIATRLQTVALKRRTISEEQKQWAKTLWESCGGHIPSLLDGVPDEAYAREILILLEENQPEILTELQVVQVGDCLIYCLPGEFFVEFGLKLKQQSGASRTMVFGLANDYIGYVPTQVAFAEGGYETKTSRHSQLQPEAGDEVVKILQALATEIKRGHQDGN